MSSQLIWPEPDMTPVDLDAWWWWRKRNLDLYDSNVGARIDAIKGIEKVVQGLAVLAKGRAGGILSITGGKIADQMPWEALERGFIDRALDYHPVRADGTIAAAPADRTGALRVALLVGHEGNDKTFARDEQLAQLKSAFSASAQVKARIADADAIATLDLVAVPSDKDRSDFFADADPHAVFYFGHGRAGSVPAIWVGPENGGWLPLERLAGYATNQNPFPASWIFIACSIGEAPSHDAGPAGPEAFRILATRGARAMLAMRARIRPQLGQIVAASLIESLSGKIPLEFAAATARKTARRARQSGTSSLVDWAAPAVWSTVVGPNPPRSADILPQLIAAKLTRVAADDPGVGLGPPDNDVAQTAARWSQDRRVRVDVAGTDEPALAALFAKIAGAIAAQSPRPTLFVRLRETGSFALRLAEWASSMLAALDGLERETVIGRALRQLSNRDLDGLEALVGIPDIALIFSSPPNVGDITAWAIFEGAGADATIVLGYASVNQEQRPLWTLDRVDTEATMQIARDALQNYPATLALLAVLDGPAKREALALITGEASAEMAADLTINMPSGIVLAPGVRDIVRSTLQDDELARAHQRAFEARRSVPALIESDDIFAPVRDLAGAGAIELVDFVNAFATRFASDWGAAEWLRLGRSLESARDRWDAIDPRVLLEIASALVERQTLRQALPWLDAVQTDDPLLNTTRLSLLSEIAKAEGTPGAQQKMWRHAQDALRQIQEAKSQSPLDPRLRARARDMKANIARLNLYFNHDAEGTRVTFTAILDELNRENEATVASSLVATLRNLAECLFEFEPFRSAGAERAEARRHLRRAIDIARRHCLDSLGAEAAYSTAKLDEVESDWAAARDHLTGTIELARSAGHAVCQRIAEMRLFRLSVQHENTPFDHTLFAVRLRKLEFLESHVWAKRYAAQARAWAARELERAGDLAGMRLLLVRNIQLFEPLAQVASDSDKHLVALSHAGLASAGAVGNQESWTRFRELSWSAVWIEEHDAHDPSAYWRGDV
ncbi:hypothetical protein [Bradyrhizobium yuanmingense]|uniref:hypothetical protein n=1 Tax=Bradyrhizobium yuanmingense TaxID=108015 RepID=UPI00114CB597|nr:hypothetical protein [Bradyrhizobium yuanmingense]